MKPRKLKQRIFRRCFYPFYIFCMMDLFSGFLLAQNNQVSVVLLEAAELTIHGKTNINSFSCNMVQNHLNDTLATMVNPTTDKAGIFEGLEIFFKVVDFKCDLPLMTKVLRQLLNEKEYPFIRMQIDEVYLKSPNSKQRSEAVTAYIFLNIAGEQRYEYVTDAKIERNKEMFIFSGTYQLHMTDFKITPPTKMLGTVRTKDLLNINFSIVLKLQ